MFAVVNMQIVRARAENPELEGDSQNINIWVSHLDLFECLGFTHETRVPRTHHDITKEPGNTTTSYKGAVTIKEKWPD